MLLEHLNEIKFSFIPSGSKCITSVGGGLLLSHAYTGIALIAYQNSMTIPNKRLLRFSKYMLIYL